MFAARPMRVPSIQALAQRFASANRASATVEFALSSLALFTFLMVIINLGDLGLTLGALQHGLQGGARAAAVAAAANLSGNTNEGETYCPLCQEVRTDFNNFASPPLPASNSGNNATPQLYYTTGGTLTAFSNGTSPWVYSGSSPQGSYLALTVKYKWVPLGFAALGTGINLSLTTVVYVMGTTSGTPKC
jgi:hypothetical protein